MKNKKKIFLLSNFENTKLYHKLFYSFINELDIYWYVVNKSNYLFLKKYYDNKKIIFINKKNFKNFKNFTNNELNEDIKLNEIMSTDRALNQSLKNFDYLKTLNSFMFFFLKENKFSFIFGEFTWSYEILISRVAKFLNIPYYNIQSTRYPSNRFLFFSNERQNKFYLRNKPEDFYPNFFDDKNLYEEYITKKNAENRRVPIILKKGLNLMLGTYFDKNDPTYTTRLKRIYSFIRKFFISSLYLIVKKKNIKEIRGKYFIYFLQKQPEATTDVKGMYYSNQLENINMIWKILPPETSLIIKEHPNCIGDRSLNFYRKLLKLNNVYLSDGEKFDEIIRSAVATFSIASTASLKSALMNIPSFTFTETFFNCLKYSYRISIEDIRNCQNFSNLLEEKIKTGKFKINNLYLQNSFPGIINLDKMNTNQNLIDIKDSIYELLNSND